MPIASVIAQLRTTDLNESIRFYTQEIGLALEFQYEDFYAGIRAGNQVFHLKLVDEKDPSIKFVDDGEHFHLALPVRDDGWTRGVRGPSRRQRVTDTGRRSPAVVRPVGSALLSAVSVHAED